MPKWKRVANKSSQRDAGRLELSPTRSAGLVIRTSAGRTVGKVSTFRGKKETQEVIDGLLGRPVRQTGSPA